MEINYFDIVILLVLLFFTLRGAFRGAIEELTGLVSVAVGIFAARQYSTEVSVHLKPFLAEEWIVPAAFVLIFFICIVVVALLGYFLRSLLNALFVGFVDHALGGAVGAVKGFIICIAVAYIAQIFLIGSDILTNSLAMPYLQKGVDWITQVVPL